jgi:hypothetical protein
MDLHTRFEKISAARYVVLSPEEAHVTFTFDFAAPPPVVWEWLNDPRRRNQVDPSVNWSAAIRPGGRSGVGASNHCAHGKNSLSCETILDWRPFDYVTSMTTSNKMPDKFFDMMETVNLEPIGNGNETRAQWNNKFQRLPGFIARVISKPYLKQFHENYLEPLNQMMQEELGQTEPSPAEPAEAVVVAAEGDVNRVGPADPVGP